MDRTARNLAFTSLIIGVIIVIFITHKVGIRAIIDVLINASPVFIACYLITSLLIAGMLTLKWKVVLNAHGIDIPYRRLFTYRLVGYSVSYLTPSAHVGGEPIRAYLLQREDVPVNTAFSTVIVDKTIEIITDVVFFFIGALFIIHAIADKETKLIILGVSLVLMLMVGLFIGGILGKRSMFVTVFRMLRLHKVKRFRAIEQNLADIEKQIEFFYRHRKDSFLIIIVIMIMLWTLMFFEYRFALLMLGHIATPAQIFLVLTGIGLAYSLPVPAAIGTLELGQLSAAIVLGLSAATAIGLAFIVRTRDLTWTIIGLIILGFNNLSFRKLSSESTAIDREFQRGKLLKRRDTIDINAKTGSRTARGLPAFSELSPRMRRILSRWHYTRIGKTLRGKKR